MNLLNKLSNQILHNLHNFFVVLAWISRRKVVNNGTWYLNFLSLLRIWCEHKIINHRCNLYPCMVSRLQKVEWPYISISKQAVYICGMEGYWEFIVFWTDLNTIAISLAFLKTYKVASKQNWNASYHNFLCCYGDINYW